MYFFISKKAFNSINVLSNDNKKWLNPVSFGARFVCFDRDRPEFQRLAVRNKNELVKPIFFSNFLKVFSKNLVAKIDRIR